jgi:hypothetical protein
MKWVPAAVALRIGQFRVDGCNRDFRQHAKGVRRIAERQNEQTNFTKRLDMTTISRARVPRLFKWSVGGML